MSNNNNFLLPKVPFKLQMRLIWHFKMPVSNPAHKLHFREYARYANTGRDAEWAEQEVCLFCRHHSPQIYKTLTDYYAAVLMLFSVLPASHLSHVSLFHT